MVYEQKDLQLVLDKAHLLMDLPEISSWEKVEVALKLKKAEQAITLARSYIKKYDPNLLSS